MATTTFGGVNYQQNATEPHGIFGLLRKLFAGHTAQDSALLNQAVYLGPEQMKEIGAYADMQTGLVYDNHVGR